MIKDIADFIRIYKGVVTPEWCDELVNRHRDCEGWSKSVCGFDSSYHPEIRDCDILELSQNDVAWYDPKVDAEVYKVVSAALQDYVKEFTKLFFVNGDNGYTMIRYRNGEKIASHIDVGSSEHRVLSCSIQLNDGFEGGDWQFWGKKIEGVEKGDLILFPSNFCFEHEITPVTKGERYSILTFLKSVDK